MCDVDGKAAALDDADAPTLSVAVADGVTDGDTPVH